MPSKVKKANNDAASKAKQTKKGVASRNSELNRNIKKSETKKQQQYVINDDTGTVIKHNKTNRAEQARTDKNDLLYHYNQQTGSSTNATLNPDEKIVKKINNRRTEYYLERNKGKILLFTKEQISERRLFFCNEKTNEYWECPTDMLQY